MVQPSHTESAILVISAFLESSHFFISYLRRVFGETENEEKEQERLW
jgi:hypothetical protein